MHHEIKILWATHSVHHHGEEFNLSTALRQTSTGWLWKWVFYLPMIFIGIPGEVFITVAGINLVYQFWVHTKHIGHLGFLEKIFITPMNHGIHHAKNKEYIDGGFNLQTGGRLTGYKSNEILFSVGFFGDYEAPQNIDSTFGKIISINKDTKDYKVVSMGHRNPQGLFFSKEKNIIINTEHGPKGGDEVNFNFLNNSKILNYGWPISSYGEPYPQQDKNFFIKNGFLKKNHSDYNFEEPIKYFTPSIGISEVTFVNNKLYIASLRAESIYIIELSKDYKTNKQKRLKFEGRIRDLKYDNENKVFLILFENVPSIGVLKFN